VYGGQKKVIPQKDTISSLVSMLHADAQSSEAQEKTTNIRL